MINEFDFEFDPDMGLGNTGQQIPQFLIDKDIKMHSRSHNHSFAGRRIGFEQYDKPDKDPTLDMWDKKEKN